jgi:hypothetical protein
VMCPLDRMYPIVFVSLTWLILSLCISVYCLLICWRCIAYVSIVSLPPCYALLIFVTPYLLIKARILC